MRSTFYLKFLKDNKKENLLEEEKNNLIEEKIDKQQVKKKIKPSSRKWHYQKYNKHILKYIFKNIKHKD